MEDRRRIVKSAIRVGALVLAVIMMLLITRFGTFHSIKLNSFDNESDISFGVHMVKEKSLSFGRLNFRVSNVDKFINNVLLEQDNFLYTLEDQHYTYYVFNNNGYYYIAYAGISTITIENLVTLHDVYQFPFFSTAPIINTSLAEEEETVHTWEQINKIRYGTLVEEAFTSYEDVKAYYENVNPIYWTFDDINKTIQIKVYKKLFKPAFLVFNI